jgi:hypothetical protein
MECRLTLTSKHTGGPVPALIALALIATATVPAAKGEELTRGEVYAVTELSFRGPRQGVADTPARDVEFWVRFRHESGQSEYRVHGFWDGDGQGSAEGELFKVRFCPTKLGRWTLAEVHSNARELDGQHRGDTIVAAPSRRPGFWLIDPESPGGRWYRRSDGSHPYIFGNTQYTFVSGYMENGRPKKVGIAEDVARNAQFFKKLRFALHGNYYPNPTVKPFIDDQGQPTEDGDFSHRPNPAWFSGRMDVAVRSAFEHDLIADLILAGPDTENARSTLRARHNGGDPSPFLRYIAARYGSYPNVWLCLCNEFNIKKPPYGVAEAARFGATIRGALPYPTPLSVHPDWPTLWSAEFDDLPPWNDHQIIQHKLRAMAPAADVMEAVWHGPSGRTPRNKPTINDELSYQGAGDKHTEADTVEAHLGAFLGGGYASTGSKYGNKKGQYFWGEFDPNEHTAARSLKFLREAIDAHITFWKMAPSLSIFENLDPDFRGLAWPEHEFALGTNKARTGIIAALPAGQWTITRYNIATREASTLARGASGRFTFDAPDSRAVLFHFQKESDPR